MRREDLEEYRRMALDRDTDAWPIVLDLCDEMERMLLREEARRCNEAIDRAISKFESKRASLDGHAYYLTVDHKAEEYIQSMERIIPELIAEIRRLRVEAARVQA